MDGVILINKEKGITSFGIVSKIKKIFNTKKVGHCGTLDPEATGVLPVMIGNATKLSKYLVEHDKEYIAVLKLGVKTDSGDGEGNVVEVDNFTLRKECLETYNAAISSLIGEQKQIPPMYSAIKVDGKKLYEYARQGIEIEREPRNIKINNIFILNVDIENSEIEFQVSCSKGTYIRTLCETIAEKLGTIGYMKELKRTKVDEFDINKSITISELEKLEDKSDAMISIEELFKSKEKIILDEKRTKLFYNGVRLTQNICDGVYRIYKNKTFIGLGVVEKGLLKRDVILC